jgi:hypothetical protein
LYIMIFYYNCKKYLLVLSLFEIEKIAFGYWIQDI